MSHGTRTRAFWPIISDSLQPNSVSAARFQYMTRPSRSLAITACPDPTLNDPAYRARYVLDVTKPNDPSATLVFTFVDSVHDGIVCTLTGALNHLGRIYQMANGAISCTGPGQDNKQRLAVLDHKCRLLPRYLSYLPQFQPVVTNLKSPHTNERVRWLQCGEDLKI